MNKNIKSFAVFSICASIAAITGFKFGSNPAVGPVIETGSRLEEKYRGKIVLIVNGDDLGVTEIFTDATIDAYLKGCISSTSIIATGHDVDRTIAILKKHPELPVGIHLALTGDWKPLTSGPSLRNSSGSMWNTMEEVARNVVPSEAAAEWDAQIRKILDSGIVVTHLDSHMGCYFATPELYSAAYGLAKKYKLPLISSLIPDRIPSGERKLFALSSYSGIYRLAGLDETQENRTAAYWKKLGDLSPGIHYLFTHHGWMPADSIVTGDLDLRINEYKFWTSEETKKQLAKNGIVVIGCTALKEDFQAALK